jgi:hypothetical protein
MKKPNKVITTLAWISGYLYMLGLAAMMALSKPLAPETQQGLKDPSFLFGFIFGFLGIAAIAWTPFWIYVDRRIKTPITLGPLPPVNKYRTALITLCFVLFCAAGHVAVFVNAHPVMKPQKEASVGIIT